MSKRWKLDLLDISSLNEFTYPYRDGGPQHEHDNGGTRQIRDAVVDSCGSAPGRLGDHAVQKLESETGEKWPSSLSTCCCATTEQKGREGLGRKYQKAWEEAFPCSRPSSPLSVSATASLNSKQISFSRHSGSNGWNTRWECNVECT